MPVKTPKKPSKADRLKFYDKMTKKYQAILDKFEEEKAKIKEE